MHIKIYYDFAPSLSAQLVEPRFATGHFQVQSTPDETLLPKKYSPLVPFSVSWLSQPTLCSNFQNSSKGWLLRLSIALVSTRDWLSISSQANIISSNDVEFITSSSNGVSATCTPFTTWRFSLNREKEPTLGPTTPDERTS